MCGPLCAKPLPWDGLTVKQKPVKSNVPVYRICLNIERRRVREPVLRQWWWLSGALESNGKPLPASQPSSPPPITSPSVILFFCDNLRQFQVDWRRVIFPLLLSIERRC